MAGFLGKKITPALAQEIGSRLSTRIEGRCIKHSMGAAGVKVYDKFSRVLRVETTVNDVSFFKSIFPPHPSQALDRLVPPTLERMRKVSLADAFLERQDQLDQTSQRQCSGHWHRIQCICQGPHTHPRHWRPHLNVERSQARSETMNVSPRATFQT
ncbi:MAG: hypothetical protein R3E78_15705 [Burkholderiaceae bacterium]